MPLFEVEIWRKVTERADVQVEADTPEAAQAQIEAALKGESDELAPPEFFWDMCDSQDDGTVMGVKEIKPESAAE